MNPEEQKTVVKFLEWLMYQSNYYLYVGGEMELEGQPILEAYKKHVNGTGNNDTNREG